MKRSFLLILATMVACTGLGDVRAGAENRKSKTAIRFYPQGDNEGGEFSMPVQLLGSGRQASMQAVQLISENEIESFFGVTKTADGTYGVCFNLDNHGTSLLSQYTMANRGRFVFGFFNGRHVVDLYVTRSVKDGVICFPSGLNGDDIALIESSIPMAGADGEKPRMLKKEKSSKASPTPSPKKAG